MKKIDVTVTDANGRDINAQVTVTPSGQAVLEDAVYADTYMPVPDHRLTPTLLKDIFEAANA